MKNPYLIAFVVAAVLVVASLGYRLTEDSRREARQQAAQALAVKQQVEAIRAQMMEHSKIAPYVTPTGKKITPVASPPPKMTAWPPLLDNVFPTLTVTDQDGQTFPLSGLRGNLIIVQNVGLGDAASQAYAGAAEKGGFMGVPVDPRGPKDFRQSLREQGVDWPGTDVVYVQILLYGKTKRDLPTAEDARKWAAHFDMRKERGEFVVVNSYDLRNQATFARVPGFQLVDRNFVTRIDATGTNPVHGVNEHLIPFIAALEN